MKTQAEWIKKFGNPDADHLTFERGWMEIWDVPDDINKLIPAIPNKIYVNRLLKKPLETTFRALIAAGLHTEIRTWDGCFNVRKKRGLSTLSIHSFGMAVDLNAAWNPLKGKVSWSKEFVTVWRKQGWICGADWIGRTDGMHFQWENW